MSGLAALIGFVLEHLVGLVALCVLMQLAFCYALQGVADKQGLAASWMAWVPLLQLHPMLRAGGSSLGEFALVLLIGLVAGIAGSVLGPIGQLVGLSWGLWTLVYVGRLAWVTAARRGVSGWVGMLAFVPLLNLPAYLYVAFHDGVVSPSRLGVVLGVLCFGLPAIPELRKAQELAALAPHVAELGHAAERGDEDAMRSGVRQMLESMQGMQGYEAPEGAGAMSRALAQIGAVLGEGGSTPEADRGHPPGEEPVELAVARADFSCPEGAQERGAPPPRGIERWCERLDPVLGLVRDGGYAAWYANGQLREVGVYRLGNRHGVWTRWFSSGGKQVQAEFQDGFQHGLLLGWDEFGRRERAIRFRHGEPGEG